MWPHPIPLTKRMRKLALSALLLLALSSLVSANVLDEARKAHAAADLSQAITLYTQVVRQSEDPRDVRDARLGIAACLFSQRQLDQAADAFLSVAKDYPSDVFGTVAVVQAGNGRLDQGLLGDANVLFDRASAEGNRDTADAYLWISWQELGKGRVLAASGKYADAAPYLFLALRHASEDRVTTLAEDCLAQCSGGLKAAGRSAETAEWPGEAKLAEGYQKMHAGDYAGAEPLLTAALNSLTAADGLEEARQLLAQSQAEQQRISRIRHAESLEQARDTPIAIDGWTVVALSVPDTDYAVQAVEHNKDNSLQESDAMRSLAPAHPGTKLAAGASLAAGKLLLERGQTTASLPFLEAAASLTDKLPSMKPALAEMASQQGGAANMLERQGRAHWPEAVAKWRLVSEIETRPIQRGDALVNKAGLLRALGDYAGARADCGVVLTDAVTKADRPLFEKARLLTMLCYDEEGNYTEALARCKALCVNMSETATLRLG